MKKVLFSFLIVSICLLVIGYIILIKDYREIVQFWNDNTYNQADLYDEGIQLVKENKELIIQSSNKFKVVPEAIAGIILSEFVLNNKPANYFENYYIESIFLNKTEDELIELKKSTLKNIETLDTLQTDKTTLFRIKNGLILSLGICQISTLKAIELEETLPNVEARNKRNIKEIIIALLNNKENINYCAYELSNIQRIYADIAKIDISNSPEILVTLYSLGKTKEKATIRANGFRKKPKSNKMGRFVLNNLDDIKNSIKI